MPPLRNRIAHSPDAAGDEPAAAGAASPLRSVRTFLLWLVLACLLPGLAGAAILLLYQYRENRSQLEKSTMLTARALVQAVDAQLLQAQTLALYLSTNDALARGDLAAFHRRAREAVALTSLGSNVVLTREDGQQLVNTSLDYGTPLPRFANPIWTRRVFATRQPVISDLIDGPVLRQAVTAVVVPVFSDGKPSYALSVAILPERFTEVLRTQGLPPDWIASIMNRPATIVGRNQAPERFVGKQATPEMRESMSASGEGSLKAISLEGAQVLAVYSRSPVTEWTVAIGIPYQAVMGAPARHLAALATGVAALFCIGLLLAWIMGGRISHSVKALIGPATALGHGDLAPLPRLEIREAEAVAAAISRAAELLKSKDAELAQAHRLARFGTWSWDLRTGVVTSSPSLAEVCGREIPPFPEQRGTLLAAESWERINAAAQEAIRTGQGYDLEIQVNHGRGETVWMNAKCEAVRDEDGEVIFLRGMLQDISERKLAEQRVRDAALHDILTGLPNRALVLEYCGRLLAAAQRGHGRGALLYIDLDRFKPINDLYGHDAGDRVLQEVGRRLVDCTRHEDLVGRLGGDEFVIVLPHLAAGDHRVALVAQHVVDKVSRPIRFNGREVSVSPSIGISHFPEDAEDINALIHTADLAMYHAKRAGRANFQFYRPELERAAEDAFSIEARLRNALRRGQVQLHYQPVIDLRTGKLTGAEALLRLTDRVGEPLGPEAFIEVAETSGFIGELGEWVAAEACRQHREWADQGLEIKIAINVSPLQFREKSFADKLGRIIAATAIDPACLEIEVTESAIMESVDEAVAILHRVKALGVKIALDDFGTGYSSLSSLTSLPLDKLKVDQSFVRRIDTDQASRAVIEAILSLGQSLRLEVHGEGIESESALRYLRAHGCRLAQGYLFSPPLPAASFMPWYRDEWKKVSQARWQEAADDATG